MKRNLESDTLLGVKITSPASRGNVRESVHRSIPYLLITSLFCLCITARPVSAADLADPQVQQGQEPLTVGVLDLDANNVDPGEARAISERLRIWLSRTGAFEVIERNKMESIMDEVGFQFSGACNTDECVVQVGEILGASKMVAGSVSKVGNLYSLQVRIVDIATSRIEHQSFKDESGGINMVLTNATQIVANELAENVTGQAVPTQPVTDPGQPAVLTTANIRIESTPPGATFSIGGNEIGVTPRTVVLEEGSHDVVFRLEGYRTKTETITVIAGRDDSHTASLEATPTGFLTLTTDPVQCTVLIDGNNVGQLSPLRRFVVYEGQHDIEIRMQGYDSTTERFTINPGGNTNLEITLRRTGSAQVTLQSTLAGVGVTIAGDETQETQLSRPDNAVSLRPGHYLLQVKAKGYSTWSREIDLADGDNQAIPVVLKPKSRVVAGMLSLIPGMGQFYSRRGVMGFLMMAGVGVTAGMVLGEKGNYWDLEDQYNSLQDEYSNATTSTEIARLRNELDAAHQDLVTSHDKMNSMSTIMAAIWAVNILDAVALMPRLRPIGGPGVQTNLALGTRRGNLTLTLSLAF